MKKIAKTIEKMSKILLILMISISQISFPLEVLADELKQDEPVQEELTEIETDNNETPEEETTSKYKVMINGEEVTEYTVSEDNKILTITQEYDGEEGTYTFDNITETIDFTNMLYGDYQYVYSVSNTEQEVLESKNLTIHYEGDNSEILSQYTTLKYVDGTFYVKGNNESLTVENVLNQFEIEKLMNDYSSNLQMKDLENNDVMSTDNVVNGYQLILSNETITENYLIQIEGDYTNDSLVKEDDAIALIDKILNDEKNELNENNPFNILDATNPVFTTGSWENNIIVQDDLTNALQSKEEVNFGEELVVKYYINGFELDNLTGIQGKINYTESLLKLESVEINSLYNIAGNVNEDGKFAYLLNNYNTSDVLLTLTFSTLGAGEATISIDEIIASAGVEAMLDDNTISTTVTILDFGIGGDVEEEEETEEIPSTTTPEVETTTEIPQQTVSVPTTSTYVQRVALSSDALIKNLTIKGYEINFDENTYEYSIKVKNSVKSLDLTIELSDENASYTVSGNEKFKVGENTVTITVKAEDGTTQTYTIKVNREEKEEETTEEEEVEKKSSSKTIIIILIVLVIIGLIYVIFKDDEEDNKESKK